MRGIAVAVASSLLCACVAPRRAMQVQRTRPLQAKAAWHELTSDHFVIDTNLDSDHDAAAAAQLELLYARVVRQLNVKPGGGERLPVVAFAGEQVAAYRGITHVAGMFSRDATGLRRILLSADWPPDDLRHIIAHELAHYVSTGAFSRQPRWFGEGLAGFVELAVVDARPLRDRQIAFDAGPLPVREVFRWHGQDKDSGREVRRYVTSAMLLELLSAEKPAALAAFEARLSRLENPGAAWKAEFPQWSDDAGMEKLDALLRSEWKTLRTLRGAPEAAPEVKLYSRPLTKSEVHTLLLTLPRAMKREELRAELSAALADDPGHVAALVALANRDPRSAPQLARKAVAAHPDDPEAWRLLAVSLSREDEGPQRLAALRKSLALAPRRLDTALAVSDELFDEGRLEEALSLSSEATRNFPVYPQTWLAQARVLSAMGRCEAAETASARVIDLASDGAETEQVLEPVRREGREIQRKCGSTNAARADSFVWRAASAARRGDAEAVASLARRALALDPQNRSSRPMLAMALLQLDRPAEVVPLAEEQNALAPDDARGFDQLATAQQRLGHFAEAEAALRKELALAKDSRLPLLHLGQLLLRMKRPKEALAPLGHVVEKNEHDLAAATTLAQAEILAGVEGAKTGLGRLKALLADVPGPIAYNDAAYALAETELSLDQAEAWARLAVEKGERSLAEANEDDAPGVTTSLIAAWDTLGWVEFRKGDLAAAERFVGASEALRPDAVICEHLGRILERAGRKEEAMHAYARSLIAKDPDPETRDRLTALAGQTRALQLIEAARKEKDARRAVRIGPSDKQEEPTEVLLAIAQDGTVADVRTPLGVPFPAGASVLRGLRLAVHLPDPGIVAVLRARYRCAEGACIAERD